MMILETYSQEEEHEAVLKSDWEMPSYEATDIQ
jgi:hypothetical protein